MTSLLALGAYLLTSPLLATASPAPAHPPPTRTEVAPGIHLFRTAPYADVGLDGNSVAIVGSDGVLVFDTNGTPAAARAVLAEIRKLTDQPVRFVVSSHWHWDHWYGTEAYREAFPGVVVIAHEKTRQLMLGPALEFNQPFLERDLPGYLGYLEQQLAADRAKDAPPADLAAREAALAERRWFLEAKKTVRHVAANLTYRDQLDLHLGDRHVQVRNHGPAITPGDSYLYLPAERIVVSGDLLIDPITFGLSSYPTGWLATLEQVDALDAALLVPGHGEPQRDERLLHATMEVLRVLLREGKSAQARGLAVDAAKAEILPKLTDLERQLTGGDATQHQAFATYLVDWTLHRVYDELAGPLGDAIAPIPRE